MEFSKHLFFAHAGIGQHLQALRRITVHDEQVGPGTRHDLADMRLLAHHPRRGEGGALQRFHR